MITPHSVNDTTNLAISLSTMNDSQGGMNQICYDDASPSLLNLLLLPAIKQLGQQAKWMLWLTPENRLDRAWLEHSGISLIKSVQLPMLTHEQKIDSMTQAIKSGNYSVITVWLDDELTPEQEYSLDYSAKESETVVFVLRNNSTKKRLARQVERYKIPTFAFL
ncbi:cell division inhibitor SulA [Tatumella sp. TA1]|uniref:SulA-like leucine-rich domain-containing protein n=1 Tax=Rosenbergiella collisarenosi TaxID=1544695 RepID=UPI0008F8A369|nr:SulA-like leucine-rich domain-containing protein [Rosenbergiella collisarenosi]MBT0722026.1 cell division inhibitor SulA [Rosenbergiella collisarenosi]QGX91092.1 cell division inhibitor SulA [Tatumella sp. TA1]